jgi:hypothetical protein
MARGRASSASARHEIWLAARLVAGYAAIRGGFGESERGRRFEQIMRSCYVPTDVIVQLLQEEMMSRTLLSYLVSDFSGDSRQVIP